MAVHTNTPSFRPRPSILRDLPPSLRHIRCVVDFDPFSAALPLPSPISRRLSQLAVFLLQRCREALSSEACQASRRVRAKEVCFSLSGRGVLSSPAVLYCSSHMCIHSAWFPDLTLRTRHPPSPFGPEELPRCQVLENMSGLRGTGNFSTAQYLFLLPFTGQTRFRRHQTRLKRGMLVILSVQTFVLTSAYSFSVFLWLYL